MMARALLFSSLLHFAVVGTFFARAEFPAWRWRNGEGAELIVVSAAPRAGTPFRAKSERGEIAGASLPKAASNEVGIGEILASGNLPPEYPEEARERGWEGDVRLSLSLSEEGDVSKVDVLQSSGHVILDEAASKAARTWLIHGKIATQTPTVTIRYRLDRG